MIKPPLFVVMGVSGCGKSTIGTLLAAEFNIPFFDGDDYHSKENVAKMSAKIPLTDEDREGWLKSLNHLAREYNDKGAVIACSALKQTYRDILSMEIETQMEFVYLKGSKQQIVSRLEQRKGHFMPVELLDSQFNTLEAPVEAITVSIGAAPHAIVSEIIKCYKTKKPRD